MHKPKHFAPRCNAFPRAPCQVKPTLCKQLSHAHVELMSTNELVYQLLPHQSFDGVVFTSGRQSSSPLSRLASLSLQLPDASTRQLSNS